MKLSELIAQIGDENVAFQTLAESLHGTQKAVKGGTAITFVTNQVAVIDLISPKPAKVGWVLWLPGDKMREIFAQKDKR